GAFLEVVPVVGAETFEALLADAVGEPHIPPAPRRDTVEERVATVPLMPRASADQHGAPPFDVASASGRIECKACAPACFRASGDLEVPTPRPARHFRAHEGKSLPARRPPPAPGIMSHEAVLAAILAVVPLADLALADPRAGGRRAARRARARPRHLLLGRPLALLPGRDAARDLRVCRGATPHRRPASQEDRSGRDPGALEIRRVAWRAVRAGPVPARGQQLGHLSAWRWRCRDTARPPGSARRPDHARHPRGPRHRSRLAQPENPARPRA